jgi:hypothetical protein
MTDFLALLKERVSKKRVPAPPSKPSKAAFEGFEGDKGRQFPKLCRSASPDYWIECLDSLSKSNAPDGFSPDRWRQLLDDGHAFLDQWGEQAVRLGWRAEDLFGVHPGAPAARYDAMGLVPLMGGRRVIAMTADTALIGTRNGILTYRRSGLNAVSLWELHRATSNDQPLHSHVAGR